MRSNRIAFVVFRFTLAIVIFVESLLAVFHALHSTTQSHLGTILPWFAGIEAIAALMLLFRPAVKIGGSVLLLIFLIALIIHGPAEQMALFVYAAGVILLMSSNNPTPRVEPAQVLPQ
jgi:hypothetical protein